MRRMLVLGLMASTLLSAMPAAAQRGEGRGRGEAGWVNGPRPNQSADPGEGRRAWSRPAPEQRAAPAVNTTPVPASNANPQWTRQGGGDGNRGNWQGRGNGGGNRDGGGWQGRGDRGTVTTPAPAQPAPQAQPQQPRRGWTDGRTDGRTWSRDGNDNRGGTWTRDRNNDGRRDWNDNDRTRDNAQRDWRRDNDRARDNARNDWTRDRNDWNRNRSYSYQGRLNDRTRWSDTRRWDNGWRNDRRYDWQRYRTQNRYVYRLPSYYAPYGWNYGYRRFSIGIFLSNILFAQNYWIDDPYEYRLPPAYGPLRWVRYYDDALLVDIRDGYVVDVIHGFFW